MSDDILQGQKVYYRARASEYDEWFDRLGRFDRGEALNQQWFAEVETVRQALHTLNPVERALELACGTGNWTAELLLIAQHVTALDASKEMLAIGREKLNAPNVRYGQVDLFEWEPEQTYDTVMFGFWLSHVPPELLDSFLDKVRRALRAGGQLFMVDSLGEQSSTAVDHPLYEEGHIYHQRRLNDGRQFEIVKIFYDPITLRDKLQSAGFDAEVHTTPRYFWYATGLAR